jgi:hypothetical protein
MIAEILEREDRKAARPLRPVPGLVVHWNSNSSLRGKRRIWKTKKVVAAVSPFLAVATRSS